MSWLDGYEKRVNDRQEVSGVLDAFVNANYKLYNNHGYNIGYLVSMLTDQISRASDYERKEILAHIRKKTEDTEHSVMIQAIKHPEKN